MRGRGLGLIGAPFLSEVLRLGLDVYDFISSPLGGRWYLPICRRRHEPIKKTVRTRVSSETVFCATLMAHCVGLDLWDRGSESGVCAEKPGTSERDEDSRETLKGTELPQGAYI